MDQIASKLLDQLTEQQRAVLSRIAERKSGKEIAADLGISPRRVDQHIRNLKLRLGTESLSGLSALYFSAGKTPFAEAEGRKSEVSQHPEPKDIGPQDEDAREEKTVRIVPEALDGPYGTVLRVGYVLAVAFATVTIVLVLFAAMSALSTILTELPAN